VQLAAELRNMIVTAIASKMNIPEWLIENLNEAMQEAD
jgi:hypothetical protein